MDGMRNTTYRYIETTPISGALGAEVSGVDLSQDLPEDVLAEIRVALLDHLVIFFRDHSLTPQRQLAFARNWGEIHLHPFMAGMPDCPEVLEIRKTPADKRNFGGSWHTDQMFSPKPAMGTILYAKHVPSVGGDTMFSNQYLAYDALSDGMKQMLSRMRGVCVGDKKRGGVSRMDYNAATIAMKTVEPPKDVQTTSMHPLVRTHPETGRKSLYIGNHVQYLEGMTEEESRPLIDYLRAHSVRPEFTCRFHWRNGSLAFWDNRCTQHFAVNDYPAETRLMHRVTVCGDMPF
ncbi:MAG: TauD/TfdA dioxygenase family protein [Acetobacteraceae bacterium]